MPTNLGSQFQAAIFPCNFKDLLVIKTCTQHLTLALITCFDAGEDQLASDSPEFESLGLQSQI